MVDFPDKPGASYQQIFHARWGFLNDPHVRSLAWLLDSPDLLAASAAQWKGKIATLEIDHESIKKWLLSLEAHPWELHAWLDLRPLHRLGRYAERLMSFYFRHEETLIAQGLQLRGANQETIGEFDFLLQYGDTVLHLELATKFYLLANRIGPSESSHAVDYFIGPNLADTLGLKMRKTMERQLMLGQHPAASTQLPRPVDTAQALIKGWLFYHEDEFSDTAEMGLSNDHCRGFWCTISELQKRAGRHYVVLPRLRWLPPVKESGERIVDKSSLISELRKAFQHDTMPVLVATVELQDDQAIEMERGFIVPDDWQTRAGRRKAHA